MLGALCGCEAVTFARTAAEYRFKHAGIDFEAEFKIDVRGRMGNRDVRPHFQVVRVVATVATEASEDELRAVVEETEQRCPVFNLVTDAGVRCEMRWVRSPGA